MEEKKQEKVVDLTKVSTKEELTKIAEICEKLNYIFSKNKKGKEGEEKAPILKK